MRFGSFFEGEMTRVERACLASFVRYGHEMTLYSYTPQPLPAGVRAADAREILPEEALFRIASGAHAGNFAQFSDWFRYCMIRKTGLVWADTDVFCLAADWPERPFHVAWEDSRLANGAVLGVPPDHPMLDDAIMVAETLRERPIWAYTGPFLVTALIHQYRLEGEVQPRHVFYPLHWSQIREFLRPRAGASALNWPEGTLCVHLWNEMLRVGGYDKTSPPPAQSILAILLDGA